MSKKQSVITIKFLPLPLSWGL